MMPRSCILDAKESWIFTLSGFPDDGLASFVPLLTPFRCWVSEMNVTKWPFFCIMLWQDMSQQRSSSLEIIHKVCFYSLSQQQWFLSRSVQEMLQQYLRSISQNRLAPSLAVRQKTLQHVSSLLPTVFGTTWTFITVTRHWPASQIPRQNMKLLLPAGMVLQVWNAWNADGSGRSLVSFIHKGRRLRVLLGADHAISLVLGIGWLG